MNKVLMTIHGGVRSYRQYWGGNQVIYLNGIYRNTVPFYVENITDSVETLSIVKNNAHAFGVTIEKSSDGDVWTTLGTTSTTALTQTLQPGERLYLRATGSWCSPDNFNYYNHITGVSKVGGNVMSLVYGPYFGAQDKLPHNVKNIFAHILDGNANLQDASELILPALVLQYGCYAYMFKDCVSLEEVPVLPATTLAEYCYYHMFEGCSSLEDAPKLSAKELVESCYEGMFYGCSLLNYIECEAADISATGCTDDWVDGVASSGKFVKDYKALWTTGVDGIPASWVAIDDRNTPFFVENITNANETLSIVKNISSSPSITIEKSSDGINWTTFGTTSTTALTQTIQPGEKLYLRATANAWCASGSGTYFNSIKGVSKVGGNIMSLLYGSSFNAQTELPQGTNRNFQNIFHGNTNLQDASKLLLPATTLDTYCYSNMFDGCTSLTTTPELPASTLDTYCYSNMFDGCTGLTTAPELPATTLAEGCYSSMFDGCTGLTTAPELPATTLAEYCYQQMFDGCTSLTTAPELPATTLAEYCYYYMFDGCTALTTAPELSATTLAERCYSSMFYGCTALTTVPSILPATILAERCYHSMFRGCTALTTAPELPATTLAEYCYYAMFYECSSLTTAPALPAVTLVSNCYAFMFGRCSSLNHIECFAVYNSATNCTTNWVYNVASTGTFVKVFNATWTTGNSGIPSGWTIEVDETKSPFYVENITNANETLDIRKIGENAPSITIEISSDGLNWTTLGTTSTPWLVQTIQPGERFYLRASTNTWTEPRSNSYNTIYGISKIGGNIMSLLYGSNFTGSEVSFPDGVNTPHIFYRIFGSISSNTHLQDASELVLPVTTLIDGCYEYMFQNCTSLTSAPELPATTLALHCYSYMFSGCTSLTTAPALPATTLADECYMYMFDGCTSLTACPSLSATTLAEYCYSRMFQGCTSLTTAPALSADTLVEGCYGGMFQGCTALTSAPTLPATTLDTYCYSSMFQGCTALTSAPALPATTLDTYCYSSMFQGCTALTSAPALPATTLAQSCYGSMFNGCTALTSAPALPATTLAQSCYGSMFNGCTALTSAPALSATTLADRCYIYMFAGCTSLTAAPALPATTLEDWCYYRMFYGCTSLTNAPELPATTLVNSCYYDMFNGCSSLARIKCLATDISADWCTSSWVDGVASSGTFVRKIGMNDWTTGTSGIPSGWTVIIDIL